jgi:methionine-rich copper-binding protein CopC
MCLSSLYRFLRAWRLAAVLPVITALTFIPPARAAGPTIVSSVPATGASGVSPSAAVVFTFSEAMDTTATSAMFFDTNGTTLTVTAVWSAGNTVLTCTPSPAFPSPDEIVWEVTGQDTTGNGLQGTPDGFYFIGSGGGGGGGNPCTTPTHTNTTFVLGESWLYNQTSAAAPTPSTNKAYEIIVEVSLVSNLTATAANLMLPGGSVSNIPSSGGDSQTFLTFDQESSSNVLNSSWPVGTYTFNLSGATPAFPAVAVAFNLTQPNVPQLANFSTIQAVDATKAFTLSWNSFSARAGSNQVFINIGYDPCAGTGFVTNLPGTATSVTIPANTLVPGSNYVNSTIGFLNASGTTGTSPKYTAGSDRGTITFFTLTTIGGSGGGGPVNLGNPVLSGGNITFTITDSPGATITVQTSATLQSNSWTTLLTTNSGTGTVTITDTPSKSVPTHFYRAHN